MLFYKLTIIESKQFDKKEIIADKMEQDFFTLYFGSNKEFQAFTKKLLLDNEKVAAKELNKAITVLGKGVNAEQVIQQIEDEFFLVYAVEKGSLTNLTRV